MEKILKIKPPMMPNFATYEIPVGKRQDGINLEKNKFPIEEFSKEEAIEYGELMKQLFIKHWEDRRPRNKRITNKK